MTLGGGVLNIIVTVAITSAIFFVVNSCSEQKQKPPAIPIVDISAICEAHAGELVILAVGNPAQAYQVRCLP